MVLLYMI